MKLRRIKRTRPLRKIKRRKAPHEREPVLVDRNALEADVCRGSFYQFVRRFWETVIPEDPIWNWHIEFLCNELQEIAERVFKKKAKKHDLVCNIAPGTTKSTIFSVMFPAWVWTRMPTTRVICASHAHNLALDLSRRCRDVVRSDKYRKFYPHIQLRPDQDTKGHFVNTKGGSRYCVGTNGSVIGHHGHFLIVDDPIDPQAAISEVELKAANTWLFETFSTRKVEKRTTVLMMIMQRLHQADPSAEFLERSKKKGLPVKHINLPAEVSLGTRKSIRPRKLRKLYVAAEGGVWLFDPVRLPKHVLIAEEASLGQYGYAAQFLLSPVPPGGGMFKVERIKIDVPPREGLKRIRYWDKAGTDDDGAYTVGALVGKDQKGRFWILDVIRGQWESSQREGIIKQAAQLDKRKVIIGVEQEPGSGGKESAEATVRNLAGFRVRVDRPTGKKHDRADPFSVQVNAGNVSMKESPWNADFIEELRFFPRSRYKDQVDASSGAFNLLTGKRKRGGAF